MKIFLIIVLSIVFIIVTLIIYFRIVGHINNKKRLKLRKLEEEKRQIEKERRQVERMNNLNETIQRSFFGLSFGDSYEVFSKIFDNGFQIQHAYPAKYADIGYNIKKNNGSSIIFENIPWESVDFYFYQDKFNGIKFLRPSYDEEVTFEQVCNEISKKYKLNIWGKRAFAESKNNIFLEISYVNDSLHIHEKERRVWYRYKNCSLEFKDLSNVKR